MKFKYVYKCQRCGVVFEDKTVQDTDVDHEPNEGSHKHICAPNEYGAARLVGYNKIDEAAEAPPTGESQLEKQYAYLKYQTEFLQQIKSVSESARNNPYLLLIRSKDETLGVIGDKDGLSLGLSTEGVIDLLDLPLRCVIMNSGIVSKISLSPVSGSGPCLEMKAGTYAMYEQQIAELGYSCITAKLESLYVQAGEPFVINYSKIGMSSAAFT